MITAVGMFDSRILLIYYLTINYVMGSIIYYLIYADNLQIITVAQIITPFYHFVRTRQECHNVDLMQYNHGLSGFK